MKADWDGHAGTTDWTTLVLEALDASPLSASEPADSATCWQGYAAADVAGRRRSLLVDTQNAPARQS